MDGSFDLDVYGCIPILFEAPFQRICNPNEGFLRDDLLKVLIYIEDVKVTDKLQMIFCERDKRLIDLELVTSQSITQHVENKSGYGVAGEVKERGYMSVRNLPLEAFVHQARLPVTVINL